VMIKLYHGDCLKRMAELEAESVDAIVTDPPAGISFMSKSWDADKGGRMEWIAWMEKIAAECIRVIKPGGHALVWAIPRTSHWTGMAWENAGWVPRDKIYHCFGSGFPKSHNIGAAVDKLQGNERKVEKHHIQSKVNPDIHAGASAHITMPSNWKVTKGNSPWEGWGTALKPSIEEWWLFRKPLAGTVAENVLKHGTGGLNIDGCRVDLNGIPKTSGGCKGTQSKRVGYAVENSVKEDNTLGRFPANLIHDGSDEVVGLFPETTSGSGVKKKASGSASDIFNINKIDGDYLNGDSGSAARYFKQCPYADEDFEDAKRLIYCGKATKSDRNSGRINNVHATVKPQKLMQFLCKLITPPGGTVLDPFMGSGSTGKAAVKEGFKFIGIEKEKEYLVIANARIAHAKKSRGLFNYTEVW